MHNNDIITFRTRSEVSYRQHFSDNNFHIIDEMCPLLKIGNVFTNNNVLNVSINPRSRYVYKYDTNPHLFGNSFKRVNRNRWRIEGNTIFTGQYSALGYSQPFIYNKTYDIVNFESTKWNMSTNYDIFILAVLNKPYRYEPLHRKISYKGIGYSLNKKDITIFISQEKFKSPKFMKEEYNLTVRKYLLEFIKDIEREGKSKIEIVSDEFLSRFIPNGVNLNTNSILEIHKIEQRVLDNVLSDLTIKSIK